MKELKMLKDVEAEILRFQSRLSEYIEVLESKTGETQGKKSAAVKRGALDLKNELTKITQFKPW